MVVFYSGIYIRKTEVSQRYFFLTLFSEKKGNDEKGNVKFHKRIVPKFLKKNLLYLV